MKSFHKKVAISLLFSAMSALMPFANAETVNVKLLPGLWEDDHVMLINGQNVLENIHKQMEKNMAHMSPEQRAIAQQSLANSGANGKRQYCLTATEVAKGLDIDVIKKKMEETQKGCTVTIISASDKGGKFTAACTMPDGSNSNADGEYVVKSNKEWTYNMISDAVMSAGPGTPTNKIHATVEAHARWKDSSCGNISASE